MYKETRNTQADNLNRNKIQRNKSLRIFFIVLGFVSLGLGTLGMIIPVLPTTPFLLLTAYLFGKSSAKFHKWLFDNRLFGKYLRNYVENKGIPALVKIASLSLLWITILFAVIFVICNLFLQFGLLLIACAVTIHILCIKTLGKGK